MDDSVSTFVELGNRLRNLVSNDSNETKRREAKDLKEWVMADGLESIKPFLSIFLRRYMEESNIISVRYANDELFGYDVFHRADLPIAKSGNQSTVLDLKSYIINAEDLDNISEIINIRQINPKITHYRHLGFPLKDTDLISNNDQFEITFRKYPIMINFGDHQFQTSIPLLATGNNWTESIFAAIKGNMHEDIQWSDDPYVLTYSINGEDINSESNKHRKLYQWWSNTIDPGTKQPHALMIHGDVPEQKYSHPILPIEPLIDFINKQDPLPIRCESKDYTLQRTSKIGQGSNAAVIEACLTGTTDCNYVAKLIPITVKEWKNGCLTANEHILYELALSRWMGDLGIGPKIHDAFRCSTTNEVIVIMDRYTGTLEDLLLKGPIDIKPIVALIDAMHQAGVFHRDLHEGNIFYRLTKTGIEYAIGDYGLALITNNALIHQKERERFIAIMNGNRYAAAWKIPYRLERNGKPCEDWEGNY